MQHPAPPQRSRPRGFTLVELLAVIMIIAMLAALITPAVMRSLSAARAAAVKTEIDMLHMALMNYKNEYGAFPPADMSGLWVSGSTNVLHPAYKHLLRIFPRMQEQTVNNGESDRSPFYFMAQMSPAQSLVFWLQGYFENPQYPLTNNVPLGDGGTGLPPSRAGGATGSRKKLYDFDESRLYAASPYLFNAADPQEFSSRSEIASGLFQREYPAYFPPNSETGVPYVYFAAATYSNPPMAATAVGVSPDMKYFAKSRGGESTFSAPYFASNASVSTSSWAEMHWNGSTAQLIAGGRDGVYGPTYNPASLPAFISFSFPQQITFNFNGSSRGPYASAASSNGHADNITNFATGPLLEAAEKLLNQ